jgi:hypothetical protein
MVNKLILYAAIMTLRLVELPASLIISSVSGILNGVSLVLTAAACLLFLGPFEPLK